ncbi:MAG: LEA type 2 family protein [Bacteroidota bacterium]
MTKQLPFLFYGLIILLLFSSCKSFKEPEFTGIENVRVGEIGLDGSLLNLDLHYFNHNKSRLQLKYAEGDAWLDETKLGHFTVDTLIHIPANADFFLPVTLKVDMAYILKNALSAFINKEVTVKIDGNAKVGKGGIFIHYPIRYEGKQNLAELMKIR